MPTAYLNLTSHSGSGIFRGKLEFAFLPQPGQIIDMTNHPDRERFPAIEESEPWFAVLSVAWSFDSEDGQMIPHIEASYHHSENGGGVMASDVLNANPLYYPFAFSD